MKRKIMLYFFGFIFIYFIIGGFVFNHIFPPPKPDYGLYFKGNHRFNSKEEGFIQEFKKLDKDWVHLKITMKPKAAGPPEHIHESFDEYFFVEKGKASLLINGKKVVLEAGQQIIIPKGTPHKPFNETYEEVILNDLTNQNPTMPADFAYGLAEMYPVMDKVGANSPKMMLKLSALGNGFDTWITEAPIPIQKAIRWLFGPTARLLGY